MKTRAPPPEARRAEERGRTPRRTPPIFTPSPLGEAEASERQRASSTRSPAVDAAGVTAGRGMASPRRRPRPAAPAAGLWPKRGRPAPRAKRSGARVSVAARQRRAYGGEGRAKGGSVAAAQGGLEESAAKGDKEGRAQKGKAAAWGEARPRGERQGRARGERIMGFYFCALLA